jgi:hypothetical protein
MGSHHSSSREREVVPRRLLGQSLRRRTALAGFWKMCASEDKYADTRGMIWLSEISLKATPLEGH